jgi:hypothetical protein
MVRGTALPSTYAASPRTTPETVGPTRLIHTNFTSYSFSNSCLSEARTQRFTRPVRLIPRISGYQPDGRGRSV